MKKKNGFTLVELLAVLIILSILLLISIPVIKGVIEDSRKDAFFDSVEILIRTTNMDIVNKAYEKEYSYNIVNGVIPELDIDVKNTEGMNGIIVYNDEGIGEYAIYNDRWCVKKIEGMNKPQISTYVKEKCIVPKNLLKTLSNLVSNKFDKVTSGEGQIINLGIYGIRYQGKNPNNYIYFNCFNYNDSNSDTCELWRIIGVVDGNVKIMRSASLGYTAWDTKVCDENGENCVYDNNWSDASLQTYLNGEYYTSMITKNALTGNLVQASTWYLKGYNNANVTKDVMYYLERTAGELYGSNPEKIENTNMGLMYVSDYGYAAMENDTCLATTTLSYYGSCKESNWIGQLGSWEWLITPSSSNSSDAFYVQGIQRWVGAIDISSGSVVRPVLYLTSDVRLSGGMGTQENPYTFWIE